MSKNENCLFGMRCESCGEEDALYIGYTMNAVLLTWDSGTDDIHGDLEFDGHSVATCPSCNWTGTVNDLYLAHDAHHGTSNGTPKMTTLQAAEAMTVHADAATTAIGDAAAAAYNELLVSWPNPTDDPSFDVAQMVRDIDAVMAELGRYRDLIA